MRVRASRATRCAIISSSFFFDVLGELRRIIRIDDERVEVAPSERDSFLHHRRERLLQIQDPTRRRLHEKLLERMPFPERHPGYTHIVVAKHGQLWAQRNERDWDVFAEDGRLIAEARLPPDIDIYEIGDGYLLGGLRDELDVEHIVLSSIRLSSSSAASGQAATHLPSPN